MTGARTKDHYIPEPKSGSTLEKLRWLKPDPWWPFAAVVLPPPPLLFNSAAPTFPSEKTKRAANGSSALASCSCSQPISTSVILPLYLSLLFTFNLLGSPLSNLSIHLVSTLLKGGFMFAFLISLCILNSHSSKKKSFLLCFLHLLICVHLLFVLLRHAALFVSFFFSSNSACYMLVWLKVLMGCIFSCCQFY